MLTVGLLLTCDLRVMDYMMIVGDDSHELHRTGCRELQHLAGLRSDCP